MKTIILPGFSIKNKDWALSLVSDLSPLGQVEMVSWPHWQTGNPASGWTDNLAKEIVNCLSGKQINIVAKSIGTLVAVNILKLTPNLINKLILCGVPIADLSDQDKTNYQVLKDFSVSRVLCLQNQFDNHGSFDNVKQFLHAISLNIKILSFPRSDHEYPHSNEIYEFLKSSGE